jgi:hypothetical protein
MHNLFLGYFGNLYTFRAYLGPSSGGTTVCIQQMVLIILFRWLSVVLDWNNQTRTTDSHLTRITSTNCCIHTVVPPDDGPRYVRNMQMLTKYTRNKLCIMLAFLYTVVSRCAVNKTHKEIRLFPKCDVGIYRLLESKSCLHLQWKCQPYTLKFKKIYYTQ